MQEMNCARAEREAAKQKELKAQLASEAHVRTTVYSASLIASACRRWLARKELRKRCARIHEKRFDGDRHAFYYVNKLTGQSGWKKPTAMGSFDIPAKNEWILLRDAHRFPYYFNPCSIKMSWEPPREVQMCQNDRVAHDWWREYPPPQGPCPNFGVILSKENGRSYCQECYVKMKML